MVKGRYNSCKANGRCPRCGGIRTNTKYVHCDKCRQKCAEKSRARYFMKLDEKQDKVPVVHDILEDAVTWLIPREG